MRHTSILGTIGNTPITRPGRLAPGQTVVEATSGNTGIGLAMVCAAKGYPLVVVMAENFSVERRKLMRFLGARVVLTPAALKGSGMLAKGRELAEAHGWFLARQFESEANANVHSLTTAYEILEDFRGERLDAWVTGYGSGGTLKGVGRVLREHRPETRIVVCEPDNSQVLGSGIAQPRADDGSPAASHPSFRPHAMQGWGPDFIPKPTEDAVRQGLIDQIIPVNGAAAPELARRLATEEGILAGITGGATLACALLACRNLPEGASGLCMLPDTGERHLSTPLFADVPADMTEEEIGISRSTPAARFDVPASAPAPEAAATTASPWCCSRSSGASSAGPFVGCSHGSGSATVRSTSTRSTTSATTSAGGSARPSPRAPRSRPFRRSSSAASSSAAAPNCSMPGAAATHGGCSSAAPWRTIARPRSTRILSCPGGCRRAEERRCPMNRKARAAPRQCLCSRTPRAGQRVTWDRWRSAPWRRRPRPSWGWPRSTSRCPTVRPIPPGCSRCSTRRSRLRPWPWPARASSAS
ncbi:MAG: pyridoxal-phosphate dependent enzyme [Steroidobacteraceae bacterium]